MFAVGRRNVTYVLLMVAGLLALSSLGCGAGDSTALHINVYLNQSQRAQVCTDSNMFRIIAFDLPEVGRPSSSVSWKAEFSADNVCNQGAITLDPVPSKVASVIVVESLNKATASAQDNEMVLARGLAENILWNEDREVNVEIQMGKVGNFSLLTKGDATQRVVLDKGAMGLTATTLQDHRVLIVGGKGREQESDIWYENSYIYDPASMEVIPLPSGAVHRAYHTATLLSDGMVLLVGGEKRMGVGRGSNTDVVLFNPDTMSFTTVATLNQGRAWHTASHTYNTAGNELVVIAGGQDYDASGNPTAPLTSIEVYNHTTHTVIQAAALNVGRTDFAATVLNNGNVMFHGGIKAYVNSVPVTTASVEILDVNTSSIVVYHNEYDTGDTYKNISRSGHKLIHLEAVVGVYTERIAIVGGSSRPDAGTSRPDAGTSPYYYTDVVMLDTTGAKTGCTLAFPSDVEANRTWFSLNEYRVDSKTVYLMAGGQWEQGINQTGVIMAFNAEATEPFCEWDRTRVYGGSSEARPTMIPMAVSRFGHASTYMQNGQILLVGGKPGSDDPTPTMELFIAPTSNNQGNYRAYEQ